MLAAAVDAGKGLFLEQAHQTVLGGHLLHDLHGQLILVGGDVGGGENGRQLVLGGSHFVVLRLGQNAQLPKLLIQIGHVGRHPRLDGAEIVVVQLLPLGRLGSEESPAGVDEVVTLIVHLFINEEILLLRAHGGQHAPDAFVAEQLQNAQRLPVQRLHAAQQGRLFVQRLSAVGAEGRGDAQGRPLNKGKAGGIPGGVAPRLKGGAQAAGGEGGGVRLALDKLLAGELHDDPSVGSGTDEAVMLFRGDSGHGLEPVGEMGGAVLHRPVLHGRGHGIGHGGIQPCALLNGLLQGTVYIGGQASLHHAGIKNKASKIFRYSCHNRFILSEKIKKETLRPDRGDPLRDAGVS